MHQSNVAGLGINCSEVVELRPALLYKCKLVTHFLALDREYGCTVHASTGESASASVLLTALQPPNIAAFSFAGDLQAGDRYQVQQISSLALQSELRCRKLIANLFTISTLFSTSSC